MKHFRVVSWALLVFACGALSARGEIVTFEFAGSLAGIQDPGNVFQDRVAVGAPAFASLRYDTDSPDLRPDIAGDGQYRTRGWLMFDVGGLKFKRTTDVTITIASPPAPRTYFIASGNGEPETWPTPFEPGANLFLNTAWFYVPLTFPPAEGDVLPTGVDFSAGISSGFSVWQSRADNTLDYSLLLSMTPVPERATWALLGLGVALLGWRLKFPRKGVAKVSSCF